PPYGRTHRCLPRSSRATLARRHFDVDKALHAAITRTEYKKVLTRTQQAVWNGQHELVATWAVPVVCEQLFRRRWVVDLCAVPEGSKAVVDSDAHLYVGCTFGEVDRFP